MAASEVVLDKAKVIVLFAFCLLNPFAGWAYLAQSRFAETLRPPSIADTLKPRRLAVLPLVRSHAPAHRDGAWTEALEVDLAELEDLEVVPLSTTASSVDPERDVLRLGRSVHADLVLDARLSLTADELRVYARLVRMADAAVLWDELFTGEREDLARVRDAVLLALLRVL